MDSQLFAAACLLVGLTMGMAHTVSTPVTSSTASTGSDRHTSLYQVAHTVSTPVSSSTASTGSDRHTSLYQVAHTVSTPVSSSTASTGSDRHTSPDTESDSTVTATGVQAESVRTPDSTTEGTQSVQSSSSPSLSSAMSTENSSLASSVLQNMTSESITGPNRVGSGPSGVHDVSTPHESSDGAGVESSSGLDQTVRLVTQRTGAASLSTILTTERTSRKTSEASSLEHSATVGVSTGTDTTVIAQENTVTISAQSEPPSSSSPPVWIDGTSPSSSEVGADALSEEMTTVEHTDNGASFHARESYTHSFQSADSDSFTASTPSDSSSSSLSADHSVSMDPSLSSSWQVIDFSASWPEGTDTESLGDDTSFSVTSTSSFISELPLPTTQYSVDVSVANQDDAFQFVSSSLTSASVLETSSVIRFVSSAQKTMVESQTSTSMPATSDSADWISTQSLFLSVSSTLLPSSSLQETQQTYSISEPSHTTLLPSRTETTVSTPASTSILLSSSAITSQRGSFETVEVSASSTLPSVTATEEVTLPSSPTPTTEVTSAPTPTTMTINRTTTATTTVRTTQPARRDVRYLFTLTGDCRLILNNTEFFQRFLAGFHDLIVKQLGIAEDTYRLGEISCGSVHVYVTFFHVTMPDFDIMLHTIIRNGGPGLSVPVWIDSHFATFDLIHAKHVPLAPDDHTYNIVTQVMDDVDIIVIIVACCVCGVLIAIGIAICVKECYRRKHASSFSLLDVPHVNLKLEDFTLTRIPRPRTIYKEPSSAKSAYGGVDGAEVTNGHAKATSNGKLHPADMRLRIKEHSDGIIVGVTTSVCSPQTVSHRPKQSPVEETESFTNGTIKRSSKPKTRTPSGAANMSEGECQASQRLLAAHHQGETDGTPNPVFVDDQEEEMAQNNERCGGAL